MRGPRARFRDRLSIQQQIGAAIFAVAFGLSVVVLWYFPRQAAQLNEQALLKNAVLTADIVRVDVSSSFELARDDFVQEDLELFAKRLGIDYAAVVRSDGSVLASAGGTPMPHDAWPAVGAIVDGMVVHAQVPIGATDGRHGWIRVGLDVTGLHEQNRRNLQASAVLLVIALAAILLISIMVSQMLSAPLRQMSRAAELLARGEWDAAEQMLRRTVPDDTRNEALQLQRTLSGMSSALQQQEAQLMGYNEQLEAQVARQTAELRAAAEKAQRATEAKSLFLANMSHEIRTPMVGVLGLVDLLLRSELTDQQRSRLLTLQESGEALIRVISDILDFSKIEAGKLSLDPIDYAPRELLETVQALMQQVATQRGLTFAVEVPDTIPPRVYGDAHRLRQILLNLISNAIKFTPEGSVTMSAKFYKDPDGQCTLEVSVRDTGIGIAEELQPILFSAFSQADSSTTRRFGGTGLGLSISKQLAELMNGDIRLESREGEGSCFTLVLPLEVREAPSIPYKAVVLPEPVIGALQGRVLLVEDNPVNQLVGRSLLEQLGVVVEIAADGRQAVERARDFDLVLMDCQMPVMDGFEATRRIRDLGVKVPILALTADLVDDRRKQCIAAGMDGFIGKPVRLAELRVELASYLPMGLGPTSAEQQQAGGDSV